MQTTQLAAILSATQPGQRVRITTRSGLYCGRLLDTDRSANFVRVAWGAGWDEVLKTQILAIVPIAGATHSAPCPHPAPSLRPASSPRPVSATREAERLAA